MLLQRAVETDFGAVVALVNLAYRGTAGAAWTTEAGLIAGDRLTEARLEEDLAAAPQAHLLVLRESAEARITGTVWLQHVADDVWYLGLLTIDPKIQNAGMGRRLLELAERFAAERGAGRMRITVLEVRDTLVAWYERRGYRRTGESGPFPHRDERFGKPLREDLRFLVLEKNI